LANHIVSQSQNWNACRRLLGGANRCISSRQDHVHASFHQIGRMCREPLSGHAVTSRIDYEVLAVDKAEPPQLVEQREMMRRVVWGGVSVRERAARFFARPPRAARPPPRRRAA